MSVSSTSKDYKGNIKMNENNLQSKMLFSWILLHVISSEF